MAQWHIARLIPTSGITNDTEAECRATSALLAVLTIVRDFSIALLAPLGASSARKATVEAFIEVSFKLEDGTIVRPDGVIKVTHGQSTFTALVEVKTSDNPLRAEQIMHYLGVARQFGFDAVLTISNEIPFGAQHPTEGLKVRANSRVRLVHYSWTEVLSAAVMVKVHRGVEDPEQAWILGELIRYLENPASGVVAFGDMGPSWVAVRDAAREGNLRKASAEAGEIAQRWNQLLRFSALRLGSAIGSDVEHILSRSQQDPKVRRNMVVDALCRTGLLEGVLRVPNTTGPLTVSADLRARQISVGLDVPAPTDRGTKARITWLLRQLSEEVPGHLMIEAYPRHARSPVTSTLAQVRENPDRLVNPEKRELMRFRLSLRAEMGMNRKSSRSPGFIDSVLNLLDRFYGLVVQDLAPWTPKAPRLRSKVEVETPSGDGAPVDDRPGAEGAMEDARERAHDEGREDVSDHRGGADRTLVPYGPPAL